MKLIFKDGASDTTIYEVEVDKLSSVIIPIIGDVVWLPDIGNGFEITSRNLHFDHQRDEVIYYNET